MDTTIFRCRKCREVLIDMSYLVDERGQSLQTFDEINIDRPTTKESHNAVNDTEPTVCVNEVLVEDNIESEFTRAHVLAAKSLGTCNNKNEQGTDGRTCVCARASEDQQCLKFDITIPKNNTSSDSRKIDSDCMNITAKHSDAVTENDYLLSNLACSQTQLYVNPEKTPGWILNILDQGHYQKGKLHCPKCHARVGAFDFLYAVKCGCGKHITPPVRIARNRVDEIIYHQLDQIQKSLRKPRINETFLISPEPRINMDLPLDENLQHDLNASAVGQNKFNSSKNHTSPVNRNDSIANAKQNSNFTADSVDDLQSNLTDVPLSVAQDMEPVPDTNVKTIGQAPQADYVSKDNNDILDEPLPDMYACPICLELLYMPHTCHPCKHIFCSTCLRQLHGTEYMNTKCPLCRETIVKCLPDEQLNNEIVSQFPEEHHVRKQSEKKNKHNLPSLPGSEMGPFQFFRLRSNNNNIHAGGGGSETLAVWGGVCFVILLMMLGFTVFATTVGFVLWYLMEVALDIIAELILELNDFFNFSWQALIIFCIEGNIPQELSEILLGSVGRMMGSFVKLVNRTKIFVNEGEVPRHPPVAYMVSFDTQNGTNQLLTKVTQANIANYIVLGVVFTYILYRIAKYRQRVYNQ